MSEHCIFTAHTPFVLASGSPRRKELLGNLGFEFSVMPSPADEPKPLPNEQPEDYALRLACLKALDIARTRPNAVVLGADTVVALDGFILGKPCDKADAMHMLSMLSGKTHVVVTGCCLLLPLGEVKQFYGRTNVRMRDSAPEVLSAYVATGEPMDKAGAYAIQGIGSFLVEHVEGSYTNVVGLPLAMLLEVLLKNGVLTSD